jgi:HNH endonuclease
MGFSPDIRRQVLIASARHCCICHRYKGVKVEVHHVVPQSKDGSDEFKNAIALCFDCHCDAGHYTDQHPRGTKFSTEELSAARDRWYELVSQNGIASPAEEDILYCRYLVCRDVQAFREIVSGDLTKLPFGNALLAENSVLSFQRTLLQNYSGVMRRTTKSGKSYKDIEAYLQVFTDAVRIDRSSSAFGFYETYRIPSLVEITEIGKSDAFTSLLVKAGVPPFEISCAVGHTINEPSCGGPPGDLKVDGEKRRKN